MWAAMSESLSIQEQADALEERLARAEGQEAIAHQSYLRDQVPDRVQLADPDPLYLDEEAVHLLRERGRKVSTVVSWRLGPDGRRVPPYLVIAAADPEPFLALPDLDERHHWSLAEGVAARGGRRLTLSLLCQTDSGHFRPVCSRDHQAPRAEGRGGELLAVEEMAHQIMVEHPDARARAQAVVVRRLTSEQCRLMIHALTVRSGLSRERLEAGAQAGTLSPEARRLHERIGRLEFLVGGDA